MSIDLRDDLLRDGMRRTFWRGPFGIWRPLYRLGFDWQDEGVLQPGWSTATWEIPTWAKSDGIVGEWKIDRTRLTWFRIPLTPWRQVAA